MSKNKRKKTKTMMNNGSWNNNSNPKPQIEVVDVGLVECDGKACKPFLVDGFKAAVPIALPPFGKNIIRWEGRKIPLDLWQQAVSFHEWTLANTPGESTGRFFHNPATGEWKHWVFPQEIRTGLAAQEIGNHPDWMAQRSALGGDFMHWGSLHDHRDSGAGQSGTDHTDEVNVTGLHITIGGLGKSEYSLHGRAVLSRQGVMTDIDWGDWFELPEEIRRFFPTAQPEALIKLMLTQPNKTTPFPEVWKTNMVEVQRTVTIPHTGWNGGGHGMIQRTQKGTWLWRDEDEDEAVIAAQWLEDQYGLVPLGFAFILCSAFYTDLPVRWKNETVRNEMENTLKDMLKKYGGTNFWDVRKKWSDEFPSHNMALRSAMVLIEASFEGLPIEWVGDAGNRQDKTSSGAPKQTGHPEISIPVGPKPEDENAEYGWQGMRD